jgi:membrane associated rhomboid family serine protease
MAVFIKGLGADESTWNYMLAPFSHGMWWTIFASMLVLIFFLSVTWYFGEKYGNHPEAQNYGLCNSWITVLASLCQQGENSLLEFHLFLYT